MSKAKTQALESKQKSSKFAIVGGSIATAVLASPAAMALSDANNTAATAALSGGEVSVGLVVTGLIGIAAVVAGFSLVYSLLRK